jgi:hypothetical protein
MYVHCELWTKQTQSSEQTHCSKTKTHLTAWTWNLIIIYYYKHLNEFRVSIRLVYNKYIYSIYNKIQKTVGRL